ncbi:alanine/glycine:cation symporter family protein [Clostridium sp. UBA1652]|uniref:alanine/glycine:cation symporter family protein n=1 Tax=Clostridium sp. UBA1652 TaxID=1946348 RepID=UPI00257D545E|nr:sodium:alanine symporter family protein [Clostridium sp. UBA1652]
MENLTQLFSKIDDLVWGPPLLILLIGTGVYLTIKLGLLQIFKLPLAFKYLFSKDEDYDGDGDISSFAALCTALAATIGTGNIVGVATALAAGGPGALFWMWVAALFGMATKYAEGLLAIKYRVVDKNGQMSGGPMYYIEKGLGIKWLAKAFAFFGICVALLGMGTFTQVNSISSAINITFKVPQFATIALLTIIVGLITIGGIKKISKAAELIVPFMAIFYVLGALIILITNISKLPEAISLIVRSAFSPSAAFGGALGVTILTSMQKGIARGVFSNESGLGSAPIAAAAAKTKSCVRQGLISMTGTFIDTIIVCTMTGLTLVITGMWNSTEYSGAQVTTEAFKAGFGNFPMIGQFIVTIGLIFFAFTTIIGWNYYGERCTEYLFGVKGILTYKIMFLVAIASSIFMKLELIWIVADIVNGLMALPNLVGLIGLRKVIIGETTSYFNQIKLNKAA